MSIGIIIIIYLLAGVVFAVPFLIRGVGKVDEGAQGAAWGFRLIILPGTVVFWPLLLRKWITAKEKTGLDNLELKNNKK